MAKAPVFQFPPSGKIPEYLETFKQLYRNRGEAAAFNYLAVEVPDQIIEQLNDEINQFVKDNNE